MGCLIRIDDRLIHGQVVVGWGNKLNPDAIILADDEIALDEDKSELFLLGVPFNMKGKILSFKDTADRIKDQKNGNDIIVLYSPESVLKLIDAGMKISKVNIGGMHAKNDKYEITHYVFCDKKDIEALKKLNSKGIEIFIQDLPGEKKFDYDHINNMWKKYE